MTKKTTYKNNILYKTFETLLFPNTLLLMTIACQEIMIRIQENLYLNRNLHLERIIIINLIKLRIRFINLEMIKIRIRKMLRLVIFRNFLIRVKSKGFLTIRHQININELIINICYLFCFYYHIYQFNIMLYHIY